MQRIRTTVYLLLYIQYAPVSTVQNVRTPIFDLAPPKQDKAPHVDISDATRLADDFPTVAREK